MTTKSNIFGDLPKKPIKRTIEDNRLVERVKDENLYPFKRGSFETYEEFRKRLTDSFQYNISIGIATLDDKNYDVETKKFFLNIEYLKWFKLLCVLETNNRFYIQIEPHEAKSLYYDYEQYELVVRFEIDYKGVHYISVNVDDKLKVHIKDIWLVAKAKNSLNHNGFKNLVKDNIREQTEKNNKKINNQFDEREWELAKINNKKENYEVYLEHYPNGLHRSEAENNINKLIKTEELQRKYQIQAKLNDLKSSPNQELARKILLYKDDIERLELLINEAINNNLDKKAKYIKEIVEEYKIDFNMVKEFPKILENVDELIKRNLNNEYIEDNEISNIKISLSSIAILFDNNYSYGNINLHFLQLTKELKEELEKKAVKRKKFIKKMMPFFFK